LLLLALILVPWYAPEHITYILTVIFIYSIGIQGQNLLIGYTGQISFGQSGFLAIGAFTFGHMMRAGIPWPLCLLAGGVSAGLFGLIVGFPSLRLKGPYLAIATLGFGIAVYQIFVNSEFLSGGRMGLLIEKLTPVMGLSKISFNYYFNFIIALIFTLLTYNIVSSYMGRAFVAIRDNDIAAEVMGVNLTRYKLLSFGISSFYYLDLPILYWLEGSTVVLPYFRNFTCFLIFLPNLIYSPYRDSCYFSYLICRPAIIFPS